MIDLNLANKYRPDNLDQMVIDKTLMAVLEPIIANNIFPSAFLITGFSGSGKTTLARILANIINCVTHNLCGSCIPCLDRYSKRFEFNMAENNGEAAFKKFIRDSQQPSLLRENKMGVICDEAQGLDKKRQERWLKILEEPTNNKNFSSHYILTTTEPEKLLDTILSRCTPIVLEPPSQEQLIKRLRYIAKQEGLPLEKSLQPLFQDITKKSGGHFRDAINSLEFVLPALKAGVEPNSLIKLIHPIIYSED
jgi:DNA polymerase III subunit gamma/tau